MNTIIGNKLKELRRSKNLSQEQVTYFFTKIIYHSY